MNEDKILEIMMKNSVDIGKLAEITKSTNQDVDRLVQLHAISAEQEVKTKEISDRLEKLEEDREKIDVIFVMFRHKFLAISLFALSYLMTIKEIRDIFLDILEPFLQIFGG